MGSFVNPVIISFEERCGERDYFSKYIISQELAFQPLKNTNTAFSQL